MENLDEIREKNRWKPQTDQQIGDKQSIPYSTAILMLCLAGLFDIMQAILSLFAVGVVISPFISMFAGMSFWFWFSTYEISFIDTRRLIALFGGGITELIPVVNALPFWIGSVWYIIRTTKTKEIRSNILGNKK